MGSAIGAFAIGMIGACVGAAVKMFQAGDATAKAPFLSTSVWLGQSVFNLCSWVIPDDPVDIGFTVLNDLLIMGVLVTYLVSLLILRRG